MELEIISRENIKPATPTPHNLRIHKFSILDQLCAHAYIPFILLFSNNESTKLADVILERRHRLKNSLSETLACFYPLAGEVKDNLHIECNDNGVYYVEARINDQLSNFLKQPEAKFIHQLLPFHPDSEELVTKTFVATIQVSFFNCGGISIGLYATHKLIDAYSLTTFLKAWAATARGSSDKIYPNFDAPHIFPPNPTLPKNASLVKWPPLFQRPKCVPRRFKFDASALVALKAKAAASSSVKNPNPNPSRVVAVIGLIWKCAMAASKVRNGFQKASILSVAVNLRAKSSLALPNYSIGNIIWFATAQCMPDTELELNSVVGCLQAAITKVDNDFVEELKGEEGSLKMGERLEKLEQVYSNNDAEYYVATSLCNAGFYEVDFGWGMPTWICHGAPDSDNPGLTNLIFLTDTESGDGIEALVSLNEDDMCILEHDRELLAFASINPSSDSDSHIQIS